MKKHLFALLITIPLLLISCGGSSSDDSESTGAVLQHQLRAKAQTMDLGNMGDYASHTVGAEIFECLYGYHYLKRPYEIIPVLAAAMPQISKDRLTYKIKIKEGIYFHDDKCFEGGKGREVKVSDFVYSWKRLADIKSRGKMWWLFDNKIVGLDEFREYTKSCKSAEEVDYSREVEGLRATDDYTLVIKLKRPWPQIMYVLAYLPTAVMAHEAVEYYGKNVGNHPVGTGSFKLKVWNRGSYIEMVRNPRCRFDPYPSEGEPGDLEKGLLADAGKAMPFVDRIVWRVVVEDQPRWLMFLQGDIDITSIPK
ncbi:MAG: ABC transporter substrate-binding protein, partial [Phycisphaerales bacterium]